MTILELLDRAELEYDSGEFLADAPSVENLIAALRRIAKDFAPGDEPPHWYDLNHPDFTEEMEAEQKHGRWQALTEVQAAILEELQR